MTARILTPWTGSGTATSPYKPQLLVDHPLPTGATCTDVTGQVTSSIPPSPNAYTVEVVGITQAWLNAVGADATYTVLSSMP